MAYIGKTRLAGWRDTIHKLEASNKCISLKDDSRFELATNIVPQANFLRS